MVIVVFGLAGAGKSTLARGLGDRLGLRVIHSSGLLRDLMEGRAADRQHSRCNDGYWETPEGFRRLEQRLHDPVPLDVLANELLLEEVEAGQVVIDSWALPWLSPKGYKLALRASLAVRAGRAAVRAGLPLAEVEPRIAQKDEQTRALFRRLYGFDLIRDWQVFNRVIDCDHLTAAEVLERALQDLGEGYQGPSGTSLGTI